MSKLTTTNIKAGDTTGAVATNNTFIAVETSTAAGAINEDNVRSEGVDRRSLTSFANGRREPIVFVDYDDRNNSAATTHGSQTGAAHVVLTNVALDMTASPVTVTAGDLVRIHYTAFLTLIDDGQYATFGAAGNSGGPRVNNPADAIGIVFFPTWQLSGGGAFTQLTNEADWDAALVAPAGITINNTTAKSDSIAFCSMEGYLDSGDCVAGRQVHGSWNYKHTGADITLHQIQLNFRGPMVYQYTGGNRVFWAPQWGTLRYAVTALDVPPSPDTTFSVTIGNAQLSLIVMRGDS